MKTFVWSCFVLATAAFGQVDAGISVRDYGAKGDGSTDDRDAIQRAMNAACELPQTRLQSRLSLPAGRFAIAGELHATCPMTITGAGAEATILYETDQATRRRALTTDWSLTVEDLGFETEPLSGMNKGMAAIARGFGIADADGQHFVIRRVRIYGFNFGLILSGNVGAEAASVTIEDCTIQVFTAPNGVANPINLANLRHATVQNSTLIGDHNNDHAIYLLSVRAVELRGNRIRDIGNSAIKLLTANYGAGAVCPARNDDYGVWRIANNLIENSVMALALYSYCDIHVPEITVTGNIIRNMTDGYAGSYATAIVQAACRSVMERVVFSGNTFEDLGLGGIVLLSTVQKPSDGCIDARAKGTIRLFRSEDDRFVNYSTANPGTYPAINAAGSGLEEARVSRLQADGKGHGGSALNLVGFAKSTADGVFERNIAARSR